MTRARRLWAVAWLACASPAVGQLFLLAVAIAGRFAYPYDLEWMEGGMLDHADRIADRHGIYGEPSIEFIPYLYTPLYPALMAMLRPVFGVSYQVGRALSVLSIVAVIALIAVALVRDSDREDRGAAWVGTALAAGLFAAAYPFVDGWYDLVRADTLFLALSMAGLVAIQRWARRGRGYGGHLRIVVAAAVLALSFFCKQIGVLYVTAGGVILLALNWRRVPTFVGVAGVIGLGGTWLLDRSSAGWFWTYIYEVHQVHDFNDDRFYDSFGNILWLYPAATIVIAVALVVVGAVFATRRRLPPSCRPLLIWSFVYALSCVVGAIGYGTQWAVFNAYMPALLTGAVAAGAAIPALTGCATALDLRWPNLTRATGVVAAGAIAAQLVAAWWQPASFIPTAADRAAGDRLIARLQEIEGPILIPFHPWYARLAGKDTFVHRMGVMDLSYKNAWKIAGLRERIRNGEFAAVIWDDIAILHWFPGLKQYYRLDDWVPTDARPRTYSGARVKPDTIWVPARPLVPPKGARVLWNFEDGKLEGWQRTGSAWGARPVSGPLPRQGDVKPQGQVARYGGRYFVTSYHGGDRTTGVLTSPEFTISGKRITFRASGGDDITRLRIELHVGDEVAARATGIRSERMTEHVWTVAAYEGKTARIVLVDESTGSWGHLNVDEFWIWDR